MRTPSCRSPHSAAQIGRRSKRQPQATKTTCQIGGIVLCGGATGPDKLPQVMTPQPVASFAAAWQAIERRRTRRATRCTTSPPSGTAQDAALLGLATKAAPITVLCFFPDVEPFRPEEQPIIRKGFRTLLKAMFQLNHTCMLLAMRQNSTPAIGVPGPRKYIGSANG